MATLTELFNLRNDSAIINKVVAASVVKANTIYNEGTPSTARKAWADLVFESPEGEGRKVMWFLLAENDAATVANIQGATDAAIKTNIDSVIDARFP